MKRGKKGASWAWTPPGQSSYGGTSFPRVNHKTALPQNQLGKSYHLSELPFPHVSNGETSSMGPLL